ncbi:hypothetical protein F5Y14DRAFT_410178 [Nemania sp. NC0429]|nr:hypothetical protein F5Y14DRAFT_410178 [Nemania sp. NC0429]
MASESYDIIIVGGGTAGLVLAHRLLENQNLRILILEAGEDRAADPNTLTPGAWPLLAMSPANWLFKTVAQPELGGKQISIPQGKALGGSSAINSFLFISTSKDNVDAWEGLGNQGWDYLAFESALKKAYSLHMPSGETEGDGPLQTTLGAGDGFWEKAWIEGLESMGFPAIMPLSGRVGGPNIATESINYNNKQRSYAANAYLAPVQNHPNLTVRTKAVVAKVLFDKGSSGSDAVATGVQLSSGENITASREVILCAGVFNSSRILERSGIGGADLLQGLEIDVIVDNPHVGENLQNHVYTGLTFEVIDEVDTIDSFFRKDPEAVSAAFLDYKTKGTGPMSTSNLRITAQLPLPELQTGEGRQKVDQLVVSQASPPAPTTTAFADAHSEYVRSTLTSPSRAVGNYIFGPAYTPFEGPDPTYRAPGKYVSVVINLSHPLSRGHVHITSTAATVADKGEGVAIDPRYLSHPLDLEVLARQVRFAEDLVTRAEPLVRYLKPYAKRFGDLDAAKDYVVRTATGAHHYTGTCSMMPRAMGGVVDHRLRVHGVTNLRVLDASIIPLEPTANPQAVVYGVAELGAGIIKADLLGASGRGF